MRVRRASASSTTTRKSTPRQPSRSSTATRFRAAASESAGARGAAVTTQAVVVAAVTSPESQAVEVAAAVPVSTVTRRVTSRESVTNPRSPESLAVAVVVTSLVMLPGSRALARAAGAPSELSRHAVLSLVLFELHVRVSHFVSLRQPSLYKPLSSNSPLLFYPF